MLFGSAGGLSPPAPQILNGRWWKGVRETCAPFGKTGCRLRDERRPARLLSVAWRSSYHCSFARHIAHLIIQQSWFSSPSRTLPTHLWPRSRAATHPISFSVRCRYGGDDLIIHAVKVPVCGCPGEALRRRRMRSSRGGSAGRRVLLMSGQSPGSTPTVRGYCTGPERARFRVC
jgi:hypothetical protein